LVQVNTHRRSGFHHKAKEKGSLGQRANTQSKSQRKLEVRENISSSMTIPTEKASTVSRGGKEKKYHLGDIVEKGVKGWTTRINTRSQFP